MSKITCDFCGTTYDDGAERCPMCGWVTKAAAVSTEIADDTIDISLDDAVTEAETAAETAVASKPIFDYDAVNDGKTAADMEEPDEDEAEDDEDQPKRANPFLVILLVIVIILLLLASGFMLMKYYLPGRQAAQANQTETTAATTAEVIETVPETPAEVACTGLSAPTGVDTLVQEGQYWLLHVVASPEDTTDVITYASEDESVATVDENGRVTAVGEGETQIIVTCGEQTLTCPVTVRYEEETEPTEVTEEVTAAPVEEKQEETTAPADPDVVLKLKKTDISFGRMGVYTTLELDCELTAEQVTWSSNNPGVARVEKDGKVYAVAPGIANITASYKGQEVLCIVRCNFSN